MLHVSSRWYFSAPHAAPVSTPLLSICFWLTACLCALSKRRQVSLNKLMGSFIFRVLFFFTHTPPNFWKYCSLGFTEELYTVGPRSQKCFNSQQQIMRHVKQFYTGFQLRVKDVRLKAHLLLQLVLSPVFTKTSCSYPKHFIESKISHKSMKVNGSVLGFFHSFALKWQTLHPCPPRVGERWIYGMFAAFLL